jgi:hypothetical protein
LQQEIDRCTFALGVALVASVGHFNPASLIFAALLLLSSKEEPASRKGKTQHWVLRPRTTRFVWAVLVCDLLLLPSVVFLFVACREMKSLLTTYVPEECAPCSQQPLQDRNVGGRGSQTESQSDRQRIERSYACPLTAHPPSLQPQLIRQGVRLGQLEGGVAQKVGLNHVRECLRSLQRNDVPPQGRPTARLRVRRRRQRDHVRDVPSHRVPRAQQQRTLRLRRP